VSDWNVKIIEEFRANAGAVGGQFAGAPLLLLTTTGAKSGEPRVSPMMYLDAADAGEEGASDRVFVFASKAGMPTNPAWYHNLKANPKVTVERGADTYEATATEVTGADRDRVYAEQARRYPGFAEYQEKTDRVIPVIALDR